MAILSTIAGALAWTSGLGETAGNSARNCDLREYQSHLAQLQQLVQTCKTSLLTPAQPDGCKPESVGPDDAVATQSGRRLVEYNWLRLALGKASSPADQSAESKTIANLTDAKERIKNLDAAKQRLQSDLSATDSIDRPDASARLSISTNQANKSAATLKAVLATSEFHRVTAPSPFDRAMQRVFDWIDRKMQAMARAGSPSKTFVRLVVFGSILVGLTLLVWWYVRALKRQRVAANGPFHEPHPQAASAIDWRERMQQAQMLAALGEWRQAIHHTYWAAISRLEARGNWPADRSRTPREYLLLLPASHAKRADLLSLTRSFERIWYGHRDARQKDFDDARVLLERIGHE